MDLEAMWAGLANGTFTTVSSDHAPSKLDHPLGKKKGTFTFTQIPNGLPGLETRLPTMFCGGVLSRRISIQKFVELTSSNPAKLYGLGSTKGTIQPGFDADLTIWYPTLEQAIEHGTVPTVSHNAAPRHRLYPNRDAGGVVGSKADGEIPETGREFLKPATRGVRQRMPPVPVVSRQMKSSRSVALYKIVL
ncbi:Metallo-dependent hydrolase [Aspergillus heteromorphus CBS 117.55]|uniref:dihydropyrimidinase n=1 Tax=Aspergillus heteromorphus CBS 117.55 TaxID=1448321 RepID=A0A317V0X0_9EURO|nr:Metallo-dependent hydrolase [Aspergillus heteromorphus CBS 117.55]PWY66718.1 Metallo-dependent hydrolase [Aspergillus heteromorphus CBS 117.55]